MVLNNGAGLGCGRIFVNLNEVCFDPFSVFSCYEKFGFEVTGFVFFEKFAVAIFDLDLVFIRVRYEKSVCVFWSVLLCCGVFIQFAI